MSILALDVCISFMTLLCFGAATFILGARFADAFAILATRAIVAALGVSALAICKLN